jgi:predicted O-methyltransferase YrrM
VGKLKLGLQYLLTLTKYNLVKPLTDRAAARGFAGWALDYDFHRGGGHGLEQVSIHRLFPELANLSWTTVGSNWHDETPYLVGALKAIGARTVLEIGTNQGVMTLQLAANLPEGGRVFTVDIDPAEVHRLTYAGSCSTYDRDLAEKDRALLGCMFRSTPHAARITQILHDSATVDFSQYFDGVDLAFIDGAHHYEQVKADTDKVLGVIRKGGVIFWHDYKPGCPGVTRCLHELARRYPVKQVGVTELAVLKL